jgi:hypothetical protein
MISWQGASSGVARTVAGSGLLACLLPTYEELKSRGVEFQQEPTEQPYGIDVALRDPSGNQIRVAQLR